MLQDELENQKLRPFLSIRWKLFLALTFLIVLIHTAFVVGSYSFQKGLFKDNTQSLKAEQIKVLDMMISLETAGLVKAITAVSLTHHSDEQVSVKFLREEISQHLARNLTTGLAEGISLYDSNITLVGQWGSEATLEPEIIARFQSSGQQISGLTCQNSCRLYVIFPVKVKANLVAVIAVSKEVSPLFRAFNRHNNLEVGLFEHFPVTENAMPWEEVLFEFTHRDINISLLQRLPVSPKGLDENVDYAVSVFDNRYMISFDSMAQRTESSLKWVFIQDITIRVQQFQATIQRVVLLGFASLVISLLLLYIIINRMSYQLSRILALSQAIGLEEELGNSINKSGDKRILDDELQQYDRQLAKISHKMDLLRQTESENAIKLQSMVRELNQTKNFIDRLLNDQKTVILVQKLGGEIIALNQAGCSLFEIEDYNGLTYAELFCSDLLEDDGLAALNYLYLGGETLVKAEAQWRNSKGDVYVLLWVHALLSVPGTIDPVILSICVDITAQRKAEDRLEWLAFNDPSLINDNKQVFLEYLPFAISRSLEKHRVLALLYCEISGFPEQPGVDTLNINPLILKELSSRMSGCLREYDMLTQLSDYHYVIVLEGLSDISDALVVTDKISQSYQKPVEIDGSEYFMELTMGASYAPEHTDSVPELLRNAEMAMYQAKRKHKSFFSAVMEES